MSAAVMRWLSLVVVCGAAGCVNSDLRFYEVRMRGMATVPANENSSGVLHLEFHVARAKGPGELAYPLALIEARTAASLSAPFDETLLYPVDRGEGLVVYGWLDSDGDGVFCAPGKVERSGLVEILPFPAHEVDRGFTLSAQCAGPEALFP